MQAPVLLSKLNVMMFPIRQFKKSFICIPFVLCSVDVNAQFSLLQSTIDKLESFENFSYQSMNRRKDYTIDTTISHNNELFLKAPADKTFGYLFKLETESKTEQFNMKCLYNGQDLISINPSDSTFYYKKATNLPLQTSLIGSLKSLKNYLETKPSSKILKTNDTTINGITNAHIIVVQSDTTINNEHLYVRRDFYIDNKTELPSLVTIRARSNGVGDGISEYYDELRYFDYKVNQPGIDMAIFNVPKGFHPALKITAAPALLTPGTAAPNWTLNDANGKQSSLSEMKGKVVVLDFYYIGCGGCMLSLKPLNAVYERYKGKNVVIVSITDRDNEKAILAFEKQYHIKYPGYVNAASTVKSYHVSAFPTYYFIDKGGKIQNVMVGYNEKFEEKVTSIIDHLLEK